MTNAELILLLLHKIEILQEELKKQQDSNDGHKKPIKFGSGGDHYLSCLFFMSRQILT